MVDTIVGWLNDPEVVRYSDHRLFEHNRKSQKEYFEGKLCDPNEEYWFIDQVEDWDTDLSNLIGAITLEFKDDAAVNIGIMLGDKSAWGNGYAMEAMTAMIDHLTGQGIRRFEIGTRKENERMIKLATACGMKQESEDDQYIYMAATIGETNVV